jgi:hypothetical protein
VHCQQLPAGIIVGDGGGHRRQHTLPRRYYQLPQILRSPSPILVPGRGALPGACRTYTAQPTPITEDTHRLPGRKYLADSAQPGRRRWGIVGVKARPAEGGVVFARESRAVILAGPGFSKNREMIRSAARGVRQGSRLALRGSVNPPGALVPLQIISRAGHVWWVPERPSGDHIAGRLEEHNACDDHQVEPAGGRHCLRIRPCRRCVALPAPEGMAGDLTRQRCPDTGKVDACRVSRSPRQAWPHGSPASGSTGALSTGSWFEVDFCTVAQWENGSGRGNLRFALAEHMNQTSPSRWHQIGREDPCPLGAETRHG